MTTHMTFRLTKEDAQEVLHKMGNLSDTQDLMDEYGLTEADGQHLLLTVPAEHGGEWTVGEKHLGAVLGEMQDHVLVLRDIANDARNGGEAGQALRISKQAKRLEAIFTEPQQ
jgi:hypothetical protein